MKKLNLITVRPGTSLLLAGTMLLAPLSPAWADDEDQSQNATIVLDGAASAAGQASGNAAYSIATFTTAADDKDDSNPKDAKHQTVVIRNVEPHGEKKAATKKAWLGVAVQEPTEVLGSQLGLKPGEGLVVDMVEKDSPAEKAELKKNDVLVELDGQMLVDSMQLRKLVQMHGKGDEVNVTYFRGGKKHTVSAKLAMKTWEEVVADDNDVFKQFGNFQFQFNNADALANHMKDMTVSLKKNAADLQGNLNLDKEKMNIEIKRTMDQTRRAIEDAVKHSTHDDDKSLTQIQRSLKSLAGGGVDVSKDATVVIKQGSKSVKTIVKTDDGGTYVIVADPKARLTALDKNGKKIFDGPIETSDQQEKVPRVVWDQVKPLLDDMKITPDKAEKSDDKKEDGDKQ